jgi:hypothetical protein
MPNLNPQDARTYNPAPMLWKYDPQTNILWLKLTDAASNTSWFPIHLSQFPQSVDYTAQPDHARQGLSETHARRSIGFEQGDGVSARGR